MKLEHDLHESPTAALQELVERQDALEERVKQAEERVKELEGVLELLNRHRQPARESPWSPQAVYALDEPRGPIE